MSTYAGIRRRTRLLADSLADFLFPRYCLGCGRRLAVTQHLVCPDCVLNIIRFNAEDSLHSRLLRWGVRIPMYHVGSFAFYRRDEVVARLVHSLKFFNKPEIGRWMGQWAAQVMSSEGFFDGVDAFVPIPISRSRRRQRGYNQAELIARGLSDITSIPVDTSILYRKRDNTAQTHVSLVERGSNVKDVFALFDDCKAEGRSLMVVDDVITTGSTAANAIQTLSEIEDIRLSVFSWAAVREI
ncbi:MAG: hypothetical protein K6F94_00320 [Bacteroidaceae bacterium]|nr:hypothetical protein [Bacteroidaceae bacterium]